MFRSSCTKSCKRSANVSVERLNVVSTLYLSTASNLDPSLRSSSGYLQTDPRVEQLAQLVYYLLAYR
ncbi:hypothetical protein WH47_09266 [Habropoda laboriosa]|uniref:Uncharacterized protein n=1 Tax=Habropoda laboriosa TaxID=597456 RepID=A0A0L7R944_9HYME|nr:hypothetical protein WH47_09266 [Habropoda laboriosa]